MPYLGLLAHVAIPLIQINDMSYQEKAQELQFLRRLWVAFKIRPY